MVRWRRGANPPDRPGNFLAGAALMPRWLVMSVAATALCASLAIAQDAPESLLPPGSDDPAPPPTPTPTAPPQATHPGPPAPGRETGRESCRERVCQYVSLSGGSAP